MKQGEPESPASAADMSLRGIQGDIQRLIGNLNQTAAGPSKGCECQ